MGHRDRGAARRRGCSSATRRARVYDRPANLFVAGFIGSPAMNLLPRAEVARRRVRARAACGSSCPAAGAASGARRGDRRPAAGGARAGGATGSPRGVEVVEELGLRGLRDLHAPSCPAASGGLIARVDAARTRPRAASACTCGRAPSEAAPVRPGDRASGCEPRRPRRRSCKDLNERTVLETIRVGRADLARGDLAPRRHLQADGVARAPVAARRRASCASAEPDGDGPALRRDLLRAGRRGGAACSGSTSARASCAAASATCRGEVRARQDVELPAPTRSGCSTPRPS